MLPLSGATATSHGALNVTTPESNSEYNQTLFDYLAEQVASALHIYYTPILVLLGSLGNLLSVYVFYASKLRMQSTSQYLTALALSDTLFLIQMLPSWLNAMQITGVFHREGFCQLFVYISYVCSCLSAWLVVAFTVERFVAVLHPLRRNEICTVSRARLIIGVVVITALLLNLPVLRFATPNGKDCNVDYEYMDQAAKFNLVDTVLSFTLPLIIIFVLNSWIIIGICNLERTRQILMKAQSQPPNRIRPRPLPVVTWSRSQQRVTSMVLLVSSVFICLNLPAYTMRIAAYAYGITLNEDNGRWSAFQQMALMCFNTNFGINFILYCFSGQNFRRHLCHTLLRTRRGARRAAAIRRTDILPPARPSNLSVSLTSGGTDATVTDSTPYPRRQRARNKPGSIPRTFDIGENVQHGPCVSPLPALEMRRMNRQRRRAPDVVPQTRYFTTVL